jgi:ADP-ribose pyrophosphatase YjhB (NUDIX family)
MAKTDRDHTRFRAAQSQVTLALLSVASSTLYVAIANGAAPHLPTGPVEEGKTLDQVAADYLSELVGAPTGYFEQLYTFSFDSPELSNIVVSYLALSPGARPLSSGAIWKPVVETAELLTRSDRTVLDYALLRLRAKIGSLAGRSIRAIFGGGWSHQDCFNQRIVSVGRAVTGQRRCTVSREITIRRRISPRLLRR